MLSETGAMTSMQDLLQILVQQQQQEAECWKRLEEEKAEEWSIREQEAHQRKYNTCHRDEQLLLIIDRVTEKHVKLMLSLPSLKPF